MESSVFSHEFLDKWLSKKANHILAKVEQENMSTEDLVVLALYHMDIEFREEIRALRREFTQRFEQIDNRLNQHDSRFDQVEKRLDQMDKRFDRIEKMMMWGFALFVATNIALFTSSR